MCQAEGICPQAEGHKERRLPCRFVLCLSQLTDLLNGITIPRWACSPLTPPRILGSEPSLLVRGEMNVLSTQVPAIVSFKTVSVTI